MNKNSTELKKQELYEKLSECKRKMDDLAWGIRSNEDFKEFCKWSNKEKEYRKALAKIDTRR